MKYFAIIVAGGMGTRMESEVPKQFMLLKNEPVLFHSIIAFSKSIYNPEIIVVLPSGLQNEWNALCEKYQFEIPHLLADGGKERFHSVKNGLNLMEGKGFVAVHDAARPVLSTALIDQCFTSANEYGNAVPACSPVDSIRLNGKAINRSEVLLIQTPQTFEINQLKKAYETEYSATFTDDASVFEHAGGTLHFIAGERSNIKLTWPHDWMLAQSLLT